MQREAVAEVAHDIVAVRPQGRRRWPRRRTQAPHTGTGDLDAVVPVFQTRKIAASGPTALETSLEPCCERRDRRCRHLQERVQVLRLVVEGARRAGGPWTCPSTGSACCRPAARPRCRGRLHGKKRYLALTKRLRGVYQGPMGTTSSFLRDSLFSVVCAAEVMRSLVFVVGRGRVGGHIGLFSLLFDVVGDLEGGVDIAD